MIRKYSLRYFQSGIATIEFALTAVIFFIFLFALIEFARFMFAWNTVAEATRLAARTASICDLPVSTIQNKVRRFIEFSGQINPPAGTAWLDIDYDIGNDPNVNSNTISVQLVGLSANLLIPSNNLSINLPAYKVVTLRESMRNDVDGKSNPACQ